MPVTKQRQLVHLEQLQWSEILPSSDREITPLKSSISLGNNLGKRIVIVLLTAVDLGCLENDDLENDDLEKDDLGNDDLENDDLENQFW